MVKAGVVKGTGKEPMVDGQQKVANTALYVLMQRAIVPGCPLVAEGRLDQLFLSAKLRERSGSVVECLTRDRRVRV